MSERGAASPRPKKLGGRFVKDWLAPQSGWFLLGALFAAVSAAMAYGYSDITKRAFNALSTKDAVLYPLMGVMIALVIVRGASLYWQTQANNTGVQRALVKLQDRLFGRLVTGDYARLQAAASGEYVSQFANDMVLVREAALRLATNLAKSTLTILVGLVFLFVTDWQMALLLVVVYPIAFFPVVRLGERIRKSSTRAQEQAGALTSMLGEAFQGSRTMKAYTLEQYQIDRAHAGFLERSRLYMKVLRTRAIVDPFLELVGGIALAGLFAFAGWRVFNGQATPGDLMGIVTTLAYVSPEVRALGTLNSVVGEGLAAADRIYAVLDAKPEVADAPGAKPLSDVKGRLEFENVIFSYPGASPALSGLSFNAEPGRTVAFVGPSGAGKSTIFNLAMRLYDPLSGAIRIDGQDSRAVQLASLRGAMALVSQDAFLFDDTVERNIALGRSGATQAEIAAAARAAACDFISGLPQGPATRVGEGGRNLSGGQRQRVALARALLSQAPILLLDEATSALDSESEAKVQEALAELAGRRTILVIAHRLATVRRADVIHVVEGGRIVESGRHDELAASSGLYSRLAAQQLS
jgi:subfamily B ATP-binding cassette protein MsbA